MPSALPILAKYRDGKLSFDQLSDQLLAFPWKRPTGDDVWGVRDPNPLGEEGTLEEVALAAERGWITFEQERQILDRLWNEG